MKTKEITFNGVKYPVIFTLITMSNFEEITKIGFFEANLSLISNRIALVVAAALAADEDTKLTIEEMRGKETFDDYKHILDAFNIVMELSQDFFQIPEVEKDKEPKPEEQEEGEKAKN